MAKPERILRLSGLYHRTEGISETELHELLSHRHGVECAEIHEKHGILKYQMAFNMSATRDLAQSMKLPYIVSNHNLEIEYYFKDVASLLALSTDPDFKVVHVECEPYVALSRTKFTLTWIGACLEDGKLVNVDAAGKSTQSSFAELSDIQISDKPAAKYY